MTKIKSFYHEPNGKWCYPLDEKYLRVTIRIAEEDFEKVVIRYNDPFDWTPTKPEWQWEGIFEKDMEVRFKADGFVFLQADITVERRRLKYFFEVHRKDGEIIYINTRGEVTDLEPLYPSGVHSRAYSFGFVEQGKVFKAPEWVEGTVWYQIFPDSFNNANPSINPDGTLEWDPENIVEQGKYGGDIKGIIEKLDYIESLGFNGVYLNPIFLADAIHRYDTIDYKKIDPTLGTMEDMEELIAECKKRGIRLMLDGVFNHVGWKFPQWQDVVKNREKSKFVDWFWINDMDNIDNPKAFEGEVPGQQPKTVPFDCFAAVQNMPRLNWANKEVKDYLLDVIAFWLDKGIDGWRLDVADEPSFDFWRAYRHMANEKYPDSFILGEVWYDATYFLTGDQFHSSMNYIFVEPVKEFFAMNVIDRDRFIQEFHKSMFVYNDNVNKYAFLLLGSHDVSRFRNSCKSTKHFLNAYSFLLMSIGSPSIYYGDELELHHKTHLRELMPWNDFNSTGTDKIMPVFKSLINIRKENMDSVSKYPTFIQEGELLIMKKGDLTVVYNNTDKEVDYKGNGELLLTTSKADGKLEAFTFAIYK